MRLLLDADTFICLRKWSILDLLREATDIDILMTEFVARHELNDLREDVDALAADGRLTIHGIQVRTPAYRSYRSLLREGADKGEAEAIAWAKEAEGEVPILFVSLDASARRHAMRYRIQAVDVLDLSVAAVDAGLLRFDDVRGRLEIWDDQKQGFGRPSDYTTFSATWERRVSRWRQGSS